jgi:hypothetical protein
MIKISETKRFKEWQKLITSRISPQPQTDKEWQEDHVLGEVLDEMQREHEN